MRWEGNSRAPLKEQPLPKRHRIDPPIPHRIHHLMLKDCPAVRSPNGSLASGTRHPSNNATFRYSLLRSIVVTRANVIVANRPTRDLIQNLPLNFGIITQHILETAR
jgi:hypothetical protein